MNPDETTTSGTTVDPSMDLDALRAEIVEIRADLSDTVEALAAKADVKAQAHAKVEQTREQLREKASQAREHLGVTAGHLRAKAGARTGQLRGRAEVGRTTAQATTARGRAALSRYAPWPQVAAGAAVLLVVAVVGGRTLRRGRRGGAVHATGRRIGRPSSADRVSAQASRWPRTAWS